MPLIALAIPVMALALVGYCALLPVILPARAIYAVHDRWQRWRAHRASQTAAGDGPDR